MPVALVLVASVLIVASVVIIRPAGVASLGSPNATGRLSAEAIAWCTSDGPSANRAQVQQAAVIFLELDPATVDPDAPVDHDDAHWQVACELAFQLWGLNDDEWSWCFDDANRTTMLAPAIRLFGMGEDELAGRDSFTEAPGDDPAEYTQACRYAYRFWRGGITGALAEADVSAFVALAADEASWCAAHPESVSAAAERLGTSSGAATGTPAERLAHSRSCRFAFVTALAPDGIAAEPSATPLPEMVLFSANVENHSPSAVTLVAHQGPDSLVSEYQVGSCNAMQILDEDKILPLTFGIRDPLNPEAETTIYSSVTSATEVGSTVGLEVVINSDGTVSVTESIPTRPPAVPCE